MVLAHNLESMNAAGMLGRVTAKKGKTAEKLSSGYKINRSADDASGLSISEKMRKQIRGLSQASDNSQEGISLCQIADGALDEVTDMIHRIKELSVKAANGSNSDSDRRDMQDEIDHLISEVNRVSATTKYNEQYLLDGSLGSIMLNDHEFVSPGRASADVGVSGEITQNVSRSDMVSVNPVIAPSVTGVNVANAERLQSVLVDSIVPQAVDAIFNAYPTFGAAYREGLVSNGIGLSVYSEPTSTLAYVANAWGSYPDGRVANEIQLQLAVNLNSLRFDAGGNLDSASRKELEATICHEMIHALMDDVTLNGMVGAVNGVTNPSAAFPKWFKEGMAQTTGGGMDWVNGGTLGNTSATGGLGITAASSIEDIKRAVTNTNKNLSSNTNAASYGTGYLACMYLGYMASGGTDVSASAISDGLNRFMNGIMNGASLSDAINDASGGKYRNADEFQSRFGDTDSAVFIKELVSGSAGGRGSVIGSLLSTDLIADGNMPGTAYSVDRDNEFVESSVSDRNFGSGSLDGRGDNAVLYPDGRIPLSIGGASVAPPRPTTAGGSKHRTFNSKISNLSLQIGAEAGDKMRIFIEGVSAKTIGIHEASVLSVDRALATMDICDYAIARVTRTRSSIGAYQNRLEHTVRNLDNVVENTQASESRIRDADMAAEMVEYSVVNILEQAGQSMLAQANKNPQNIIPLLQQ